MEGLTVKKTVALICLIASSAILATQTNSTKGRKMPEIDIIDTAVAAGTFSTLATALTEADLIVTLKSAGPFTVFAPTDDAFKQLPAGTVEKLLKNKMALKRVLLSHVVSGKVMAADVVKLTEAKTVGGEKVGIKVTGGSVYVSGKSKVTSADVKASNGVIHIIDHVIVPSDLNL